MFYTADGALSVWFGDGSPSDWDFLIGLVEGYLGVLVVVSGVA
jgi:hypothetical protein